MNKITGFVSGHVGAAVAAVAAVIVLVGGVLVLVSAGNGGTPVSTSGSTSTTLAGGPGKRGNGGGGRGKNFRGQITAINGATWTVDTTKGQTLTVDIAPNTVFGTRAKPLAASDFSVGDNVVVTGSRSGTVVSATRVTRPRKAAVGGTTTTVP